MLRKAAVALLLIATLFESGVHIALAAPNTDDILIKPEEESDNVLLLQLRLQDLGYFDYKITGYFGSKTQKALKDFQSANDLTADGIAGSKTLSLMYSNDAKRKKIEPANKPKPTTSNNKKPTTTKGAYLEWSEVNSMWKKGMKCKVVDFDTRTTYYVIRVNNSYSVGHADVAPATKSDTSKMKSTFDGNLNAYRRALIVYIGGKAVAASLYGEPHGSTGVPGNGLNKEDGTLQQVCIHFKNSWTNGMKVVDPAHQYQIRRAARLKNSGSRPVLVYPGD